MSLNNIKHVARLGCSQLRELYTKPKRWLTFRVGDVAKETRTFTAREVQDFAQLTGDTNPIHLDSEYAKTHLKSTKLTRDRNAKTLLRSVQLTEDTNHLHSDSEYTEKHSQLDSEYAKDHSKFDSEFAKRDTESQGCIVHGALLNGAVSALIGTSLPGPGTLVAHQELSFPNPCYTGEEVEVEVRLVEVRKISKVEFSCTTTESGKVVLRGSAKLIIPQSHKK